MKLIQEELESLVAKLERNQAKSDELQQNLKVQLEQKSKESEQLKNLVGEKEKFIKNLQAQLAEKDQKLNQVSQLLETKTADLKSAQTEVQSLKDFIALEEKKKEESYKYEWQD